MSCVYMRLASAENNQYTVDTDEQMYSQELQLICQSSTLLLESLYFEMRHFEI